MKKCSYRGQQILENDIERVFCCEGYKAATLEGKPCDTDEAHHDAFGNVCRVPKSGHKAI